MLVGCDRSARKKQHHASEQAERVERLGDKLEGASSRRALTFEQQTTKLAAQAAERAEAVRTRAAAPAAAAQEEEDEAAQVRLCMHAWWHNPCLGPALSD